MHKSVRLLKIWKLCREKRRMTAAKLAECCGVSERQIYRDLKELAELGVSIAINGGYRVVEENPLPQLNLTQMEKMVLTLALQALPLHLDAELEKIANSLFNKLLDEPGDKPSASVESPSPFNQKGHVFTRLHKAIENHQCVTLLDYRKLNDEVLKQRQIEPYRLVYRDYHWYVVAWTPVKQNFQTYRLDRIGKLRIENRCFDERPFDLDEYFRGTLGVFIDEPRQVKIRFTGLAREIVKKDGRFSPRELRQEGEALILETTIRGEILWLRWIIGFGGEAEILQPRQMREKARKMLRAGLANYKMPKNKIA